MQSKSQMEPTWIMNPSGVKSCWPFHIAEAHVTKKIGWTYCNAEYVPEQKEFPVGQQMTQSGLERRKGATEAAKLNLKPVTDSLKTLREEAAKAGVKNVNVKKEATLLHEMELLKSN